MTLLYEGKAKQIFATSNPNEIIISFKDDTTALNGLRKDVFQNKGRINLAFTKHFFNLLQENGLKTHLLNIIDDISFRSVKLSIVPLEVVVRNYAAGSICKRMGYKKGEKFEQPLVEFFYKDDAQNDPLIYKQEILNDKIATEKEINQIEEVTLKINQILSDYLDSKNIILVDFKLEFGRTSDGEILLADEISPDTCRFWDKDTMESLDKDVYREKKGNLVSSYMELAKILGVRI
jgi:phosphoribosylaminoimidazole-succinocarboxamide synthase